MLRVVAVLLSLLLLGAAAPKLPLFKHSGRAFYPPELIAKKIEGRVVAHFRIDTQGRAVDGVFDYEPSKPQLAASARKWIKDVRFQVPKDWNAAASPRYEIWFLFQMCSNKRRSYDLPDAFTVVARGCTSANRTQ